MTKDRIKISLKESWSYVRHKLINLVGKLSWYLIADYLQQLIDNNVIGQEELDSFLKTVHELGVMTVGTREAKRFIKNIIEKQKKNLPITEEEAKFIQEAPPELVTEATQEIEDKLQGEPAPVPPEEIEPEVKVLNIFEPALVDELELLGQPGQFLDTSLNSIMYLQALGYKTGTWNLSVEHDILGKGLSNKALKSVCSPMVNLGMGKMPICDALHGQIFTLDQVISNAKEHAGKHGYRIPKPVLALSHPKCRCSIICHAPASPNEIPDSAPGVPMEGTSEELLFYKTNIFNNMAQFKDVHIDRHTILARIIHETAEEYYSETPPKPEAPMSGPEIAEALLSTVRVKIAEEEWTEDIKPVMISKNFIYRTIIGGALIIRPIPDTYYGFQLGTKGNYSRVYLGDLNRIINIPTDRVKDIEVTPSKSGDIEGGNYMEVDGQLCLVIKIFSADKILCYLPELDEAVFVDGGIPYDVNK